MNFTYKLARRIARLRAGQIATLALTAGACAQADALGPQENRGLRVTAIVVTPDSVALAARSTQTFAASAHMSNGTTKVVTPTWSATGGTITPGGLFTADTVAGRFQVIAAASGVADTSVVVVAAPSVPAPAPTPTPSPTVVDTLFAENFEAGTLSAFQDGVNATRHRVIADPTLVHGGSRALEITYPAGADGGWLTHFFPKGYDSAYVSYWVRTEPTWQGYTKLISLRGTPDDNIWAANGGAGKCPTGTDWFTAALVTEGGDPGNVRFYSYYPGMPREADGVTCWGRYGPSSGYVTPLTLTRGEWHKVELWVRLNNPASTDALQQFWLDGVLRGQWSGFKFRTTDALHIRSVNILASMPQGAPKTERLYVDDLVVLSAKPK
jgi:hypothetical protein